MSPERYLRTFDILKLLVERKEPLRLTEIKQALDLPVSSLHNMLQTMVAAEVVTVDDELRYSVGPRTISLALRTVQSLDVRTIARRPLQDLAREINDDVYLAQRVGDRVFYVDRVLGTQRISLDIRLGVTLTLHSTATGKLFAAFDDALAAKALGGKLMKLTKLAANTITDPELLRKEYARIRTMGYAKSNEESIEGIVGYAIPIRDGTGAVAAAVHVSVLASRATAAHEKALLPAARACAEQIERLLGRESGRRQLQDTA
ncbi:IclR family transcriptional regulator [Piscinibacter sakaiensis]|uniref:IclR family transcriptional regulator n=1 Tax=Piscinibacter sakaiensis TaxID=1547922 RepID=UPI003AAD2313